MRQPPRLRFAPLLLGVLLLAASGPKPEAVKARSLVLITLDTTRADHLNCYGYPLETTPALSRLAREGALFQQAFTHAVNTVPSHASLFTGLYPSGHGSRFNAVPLDPEFATLTTLLAGAGYKTAAFVSGDTMVRGQSGLQRGFDVYDDRFAGQDRRAGETVDKAIAWLRKLPGGTAYFLFVHLYDPHGKYDPPAGFAEKFRSGKYAAIADPEAIPDYQQLQLGGAGAVSLDPLDYISRYDGEINYADSQIGRLLAAVGDQPIVAFTADHGETLVDRDYLFSHGARLNEEALRVPLILRFPDPALRGKRVSGMARLVDVLPTLLTALGQPVPGRLPGRNLLPFIRLGAIPEGTTLISEGRAGPLALGGRRIAFPPHTLILSARSEHQKLIRYPTPDNTFELFDLDKDPGEKSNLASPEAVRRSPLYQALDLYLATGRPPEPPEVDEETKQRLRSLGYVN